jgi:hypothetical protein
MTIKATTEQTSGIKKYFTNMVLASTCVAVAVWAGIWGVRFAGEVIARLSAVTPLELASLVVRSTGAY